METLLVGKLLTGLVNFQCFKLYFYCLFSSIVCLFWYVHKLHNFLCSFFSVINIFFRSKYLINPLNAKLISFCHLLALLEARHILHISRIRVKCET